jgi:hypothetical protein
MRIKKKYVLLESMLIDLTDKLTPFQKKILKVLHKKYKDLAWVSQWDASIFLIEELDVDYQDAYDLIQTYSRFRDVLFKEVSDFYEKASVPHVFFMNIGKALESYKNNLADGEHLNDAVFKWDKEPYEENHEVVLWTYSSSFILYFTPEFSWRNDKRRVLVETSLSQIDDNDKEFKVTITIKRSREESSSASDKDEKLFTEFTHPYPDRVTKSSLYDIIDGLIIDVLMRVTSTTHEEDGWWY